MVVRVGIVDLISTRPDSMTRRVFLEAVLGAAVRLDLLASENRVETTIFGIDPLGSVDEVDWPALASMDALIISGSEPTRTDIGAEPCLRVISRILTECSAATSLLFSCHSAHAALHLLHGLNRHRLPRRQHGIFAHTIHSGAADFTSAPTDRPDTASSMGSPVAPIVRATAHPLVASLAEPVLVPHSRWNAMTSADLREAGVPILLDSPEAEWHLATSPDGLHHVFVQGHPEYLCDTMAREYRRDLRRWIADPTLPFPKIPLNYFPAEVHEQLIAHAESVRTHRDTTLLDDLVLPHDHTRVAHDWSPHSRQFFANWLQAVANRCGVVPEFVPTTGTAAPELLPAAEELLPA